MDGDLVPTNDSQYLFVVHVGVLNLRYASVLCRFRNARIAECKVQVRGPKAVGGTTGACIPQPSDANKPRPSSVTMTHLLMETSL